MDENRPVGRPSLYSEDLVIEILTRIIEGQSLSAICRDESMPCLSTVLKWRRDNPEFSKQYAQAQRDRADTFHEQIIEIADDGRNDWMEIRGDEDAGWRVNGEHIQRSKLRVDARKWSAARMNPKRYGERVAHELTGANGGPIESTGRIAAAISATTDPAEANRLYAELVSGQTKGG